HDGIGSGQHSLHGFRRQALRVLPPLDRRRTLPLDFARADALVVVAVAVRAHQAALLEAGKLFGEVGYHVSAIHFAVHKHVYAQLFLLANPEFRRLALDFFELLPVDLFLGEIRARLHQVVGLRKTPDRGSGKQRQIDPKLSKLFTTHPLLPRKVFLMAARSFSFSCARSRGRYSRPQEGVRSARSRPAPCAIRSSCFATTLASSSRVLRPSTRPRASFFGPPLRSRSRSPGP